MSKNDAPSVTVVSGAYSDDVAELFSRRGFKVTDNLGAANAIVFTGGADVSPSLYGQAQLRGTHTNPDRDEAEKWIFDKYRGKTFIGICRGAQLLNVLLGGSMFQDVSGHGQFHPVYDIATKSVLFGWSSMHHQMMIPGTKGRVLATAGKASRFVTDRANTVVPEQPFGEPDKWVDTEVVLYKEAKTLCYQGHPEVAQLQERDYFFNLVARHLKMSGKLVLPHSKTVGEIIEDAKKREFEVVVPKSAEASAIVFAKADEDKTLSTTQAQMADAINDYEATQAIRGDN